jgi:hypothetical protein
MLSSGTLGFCFIFRFLFGYGGTFTHVFWPMQGSPRYAPKPLHHPKIGIPPEPRIPNLHLLCPIPALESNSTATAFRSLTVAFHF